MFKGAYKAAWWLTLSGVLIAAAPVLADQPWLLREVKIGVLSHDVPDLWSGFGLESRTADLNLEVILRPSMHLLWGEVRPAIGTTINFDHGTSHAYLDARWMIESPAGLFFSIGLGAAVHNGHLNPDSADHKALGSRVLFHIPLELGFRFDGHNSVSFYFEHTSNAGLIAHNEGLDRLGIRYGYRF